jgi:hypothetical protein
MTTEVERPAGLGRYCLREMRMEHVTHIAFMECLGALLLRKYAGQPFLPMWLPEYPPTSLPRLASAETTSPPIAPK